MFIVGDRVVKKGLGNRGTCSRVEGNWIWVKYDVTGSISGHEVALDWELEIQVGSKVTTPEGLRCEVRALDGDLAWVKLVACNVHFTYAIEKLKTTQELKVKDLKPGDVFGFRGRKYTFLAIVKGPEDTVVCVLREGRGIILTSVSDLAPETEVTYA